MATDPGQVAKTNPDGDDFKTIHISFALTNPWFDFISGKMSPLLLIFLNRSLSLGVQKAYSGNAVMTWSSQSERGSDEGSQSGLSCGLAWRETGWKQEGEAGEDGARSRGHLFCPQQCFPQDPRPPPLSLLRHQVVSQVLVGLTPPSTG